MQRFNVKGHSNLCSLFHDAKMCNAVLQYIIWYYTKDRLSKIQCSNYVCSCKEKSENVIDLCFRLGSCSFLPMSDCLSPYFLFLSIILFQELAQEKSPEETFPDLTLLPTYNLFFPKYLSHYFIAVFKISLSY